MTHNTNYSKVIDYPTTARQALANALQLAINRIESGDSRDAVMILVDTIDDINSDVDPYRLRCPVE